VGQITAEISLAPGETTDKAYEFGGTRDSLLYLNAALPAETVKVSEAEQVQIYQPENPANPNYRFENAPQSQLTITEGETAQVAIAADPSGSTVSRKGRYKVVEPGLTRSLRLTGGEDRLNLEQPIGLGTNFTLQLAFRWDGTGDQGQPIQLVQATNEHGDVFINSDGRLAVQFTNAQGQPVTITSGTPLLANEEYLINIATDGLNTQIYANGQLIGSGSLGTGAIAPVEVTSVFGAADVSQVDNFRGIVYGARFWGRSLSQPEIRRFAQSSLNPSPVLFTLDEANNQVSVRLNPETVTEAPNGPIDLTFRRYSYTGSPEPEVSTVTVTFDANNWQSTLALPFNFNNTQSLTTDIEQITVQISSQSDQVPDFIANVGDAYALESLRSLYLIDEISPTDLSRFDRRPNFAEGGATQGLDFERLEGVTVKKGLSENLPISGDRYIGDRPTVVTGDLTGDGKADLLVLTEKAGAQFYENTSTERELRFTQQDNAQPQIDTEIASQGFSGSEARLVDADGDGDLDLVWSEDGGLKVLLNEPVEGVDFAGSTEAIALVDQTGSALGSGQIGDLVGFDFADINQDGVLDAVVLDQNNQLQAYLGNSSFNLMNGLVRLADENNPFRKVELSADQSLALKFSDVIADGMPELYVYERDGGDGSYWRFLMPEADGADGIDVVYRDRTYLDPLTSRASQIGDLESLAFLNDSGVDGVFLSLDNAHYNFGTLVNRSNEVVFDYSDPSAGAQELLEIVSLQDKVVELDERVRLQLLSTEELTTESGLDRSVDVIIQDDDRPGVTLAYVGSNGQPAGVVASHLSAPDENLARPLIEGEQSDGFYVLTLDSQPQETVSLVLRNSDSDRLQFERIYPFALTVNADGSLTVRSRLANTPNDGTRDYSLSFNSPLVQAASQDEQGSYQIQLDGTTAGALQSAIAGKSTRDIQQSTAVQNILKQIGIRVNSDDATYRTGLGLNANQLLQERISITPQEQTKLTILPGNWQQQILLRPVAPDNLIDNRQAESPRLSIAIDSSDPVYSSLPGLLAELPITDNDQAGIILDQLDDIREGVDGGQFQVSLNSKPEGTVLITLQPSDLEGSESTSLALGSKYYGDIVELEFNEYNWNAPQTVKVRAQDDNDVTGDLQRLVQATVRSDDANYAGMAVEPLAVTIRDNDLPTVSAYTVLDAAEPGQIGFFGIRLNTEQVRNPEGLKIHYRVRGWASAPASAEDYQEYVNLTPEGENFITIAPGQDLGNVVIFPIDDYIAEGFDVTFKPNGVNVGSNRITVPLHRLIDGSKVVFTPESSDGGLPDGLSGDSFYYVKVIDDNVIELYSDADRSTQRAVLLTSGGIGETRLLDATGKATVEEAKENTKRFEAGELELLSDPNGTNPGYQLSEVDPQASVRIYDNEKVGFRFILPGQQVLDSSSPADKGYLTIAEHPDIDNTEEFSAAVFLVRPLSDPGSVQTGENAGQDNWVSLRFDPRWDQNSAQEMQVHLAEEPKFEDDGTQTVAIAVYDEYGRKVQFYQRDPDADGSANDKLSDQLEISVTKDTWAEPIRLKSAVFFDLNGNGEWDDGEHRGVTLSDSRYFFGDDLAQLAVGTDEANFEVTLADFDVNQDGYLTLFETTLRGDQPDGWGVVSELGNAAAIAVQVGDDIGKVAIPGN
ncbi:MAG: LamG domain-containing protein, partial [Phormidesmis sp.]